MLIDEEVGVQNGILKLVDFACFGVFSAVLRVTNDDFLSGSCSQPTPSRVL